LFIGLSACAALSGALVAQQGAVLEATDGREFNWSVVEQDDGVGPGQRRY
jgi:hypothetical protein